MKKLNILSVLLLVLLSFVVSAQEQGESGPSKNYERLVDTMETYIKKNGSSVTTNEYKNKVLNETGRSELSIQKVYYVQSESKFNLVEAYTLANGVKTPVNTKDIRIAIAPTQQFGLSDLMEVSIPFNKVEVGSEVYLKYRLTNNPLVGNIYSTILGMNNSVLAKKEIFKYISEVPLNVYKHNIGDYFALKETKVNGLHTLELTATQRAYDFQGIQIEQSILGVSTAANWQQVREAFAPHYKKAWTAELPEKLNAVVNEAKTKPTDKEKIEFAAQKLNQTLAYSGNWVTRSGKMFPAGMNVSIKRGKGDCKDFSTAMIAMLRKMNIEAYPFLTFRSYESRGDTELAHMSKNPNPSYFNHVIVWAKGKDGKDWWIDPTNPHVQADVISSDILGNFGILLDDKVNQVSFLPKKNAVSADFKMEHTITINADNSVTGKGSTEMSPSAYNGLMMAEKSLGPDGGSKLLAAVINYFSKTLKVTYQKDPKNNFALNYSFHATDIYQEQEKKLKAIIVAQPLGLYLNRIKKDADSDLGETGTTTIITRVKGRKELDVIRAGCLVRSKWIDADRIVENKPDEIVVTDTVTVKNRFISRSEAKGDVFDVIASDLVGCAQNSALLLHFDESQKTVQAIEDDKLKGPEFSKMTDADATKLFDMNGPKIRGYRYLKVFRYLQNKVKANPADYAAYHKMAISITELGYVSGRTYIPEYWEEGQAYFDKAIGSPTKITSAKYASDKIKFLTYGKRIVEAEKLFSELKKQYPNDVNTYRAAHIVLKNQQRFDLAEKWLLATKPLNKTEEDIYLFNKLMQDFYFGQSRYKEAIPYQEYLANKDQNDPWAWHNLAILYFYLKDYDKNIELEKKALAIQEFGMAKRVMSDSYLQKAIAIGTKDVIIRSPASESDFEKFLLESVKHNDENAQAHAMLAKYYVQKYMSHRDQANLEKGKVYLKQAIKADPNYEDLELISLLFEVAENQQKKQDKNI